MIAVAHARPVHIAFAFYVAMASYGYSQSRIGSTERNPLPQTIAISTVGRFAAGKSWHLSVNSAGKAELTIETYPEWTHREFQVPAADLQMLRKALDDEKFFALSDEYGETVLDGSETTITIVAGDKAKTVKVRFLMNWVNNDKSKTLEPSRAIRIKMIVRNWFSDQDAVDLRKYDQKVLDAAASMAKP